MSSQASADPRRTENPQPSSRHALLTQMKRSGIPVAVVLVLASATDPARTAEGQTSVTSSEHRIQLESPVKSKRFPRLGGGFLAPEGLGESSFPIPGDFLNVIACTVHVERQGNIRRLKVRLSADVVDDEGRSTAVLNRTRRSNFTGTAFFRGAVPDQITPESVVWSARFRRKEIDYAAGSCQKRSFAACAETD